MTPIGKDGQSTRERIVQRLINSIQLQKAGKIQASSYFQQKALTSQDISNIFGTAEEFMERYSSFEKKYFKALDTDLNAVRASATTRQALQASNTINLSLLNAKAADDLYKEYFNNVLRIPDLLAKGGLPSVELPTGNFFSDAFKYRVSQGDQVLHPAQVFLNRTIFNFSKNAEGLDSINIGRSNILTSQSLTRATTQSSIENVRGILSSLGRPAVIKTLDVETTGVFDASQVRSISVLDAVYESGAIKTGMQPSINLAFDSPQLAGISVKGGIPLSDALAKAEVGVDAEAIKMGFGGKNFLDETEQLINRLLEADMVAGHNVGFDLDKLRQTALSQSGYHSHIGVQEAFSKLDERMAKGNYVLDTLELARSYLMGQVEKIVGESGDIAEDSRKYVQNLFSQDILARVHVGGSAAYASMENIALNTNLFELLERDQKAQELYSVITKGSHIAETDTKLQSYMMQYILSEELEIITEKNAGAISDMGRFARSRILQSQAVTPTTNIADVQWLSDTVFSKIKETDIIKSNVSLRLTGQELGLAGTDEGILKYIGDESGGSFQFLGKGGDSTSINETKALSVIRNILDQARSQSIPGSTLSDQAKAAAKIVGLGITFQQASDLDEIIELSKSRTNIPSSVGRQVQPSVKQMEKAFTEMYKTLGSGPSSADYLRLGTGQEHLVSGFQVGMSNYTVDKAREISQLFRDIDDPFANMSMRDRVISTAMAESTAKLAQQFSFSGLEEGAQAIKLSVGERAQQLSGMGISFFEKQKTMRVFAKGEAGSIVAEKLIIPTAILDEAVKESLGEQFFMKNVGLSVVNESIDGSRQMLLNMVWMAKQDISSTEAQDLVSKVFNIMSDTNRVASLMGVEEADLESGIRNTINELAAAKNSGTQDALKSSMVESLLERGVVMGSAGEQSETAIKTLNQIGVKIENEVLMKQRFPRATMPTEYGGVILGPGIDPISSDFGYGVVDKKAFGVEDMDIGRNAEGNIVKGKVSSFAKNLFDKADILEQNSEEARKMDKAIKRAKMGKSTAVATEFYLKYKPKIGLGVVGLAAAGAGYYMSKKHRERQLYDESIEAQPIERASQVSQYNSYSSEFNNNTSLRRDPLLTAGVVGNLDRAKIGHTRMGSDRYNHLYGGGY